jgi:putative DNA primase/helicase
LITTLSAIRRFGRPGWALLSAGNLARWSPPPGVRDVLIAADNGVAGEQAAIRLRARLLSLELDAVIARPPNTFGDWNEADQASAKASEEEEGRGGGPDRRG